MPHVLFQSKRYGSSLFSDLMNLRAWQQNLFILIRECKVQLSFSVGKQSSRARAVGLDIPEAKSIRDRLT